MAELEPGAQAAAAPQPPALSDSLQGLLRELPGLVSDRVELLSLELHRSGLALSRIVALVLMAALLGGTAWLMLWVLAIGALVLAAGLHWALALGLALLLNLVGAWLALAQVRRLAALLPLQATRRHLMFAAPEIAANPTTGETDARAPA